MVGNLIDYPGDFTTLTSDIIIKFSCGTAQYPSWGGGTCVSKSIMYYLENPLGQYEDMEMSVEYIPNYFMDTYILHKKVNNRY